MSTLWHEALYKMRLPPQPSRDEKRTMAVCLAIDEVSNDMHPKVAEDELFGFRTPNQLSMRPVFAKIIWCPHSVKLTASDLLLLHPRQDTAFLSPSMETIRTEPKGSRW